MPELKPIAIVDWTHLIEDYLDNVQITFGQFASETTGGWLFGYIEALQSAGYRPIFFCVSARVETLEIHRHIPSNSEICVLPAPKFYRWLRKKILNPYVAQVEEASGRISVIRKPFLFLLLSIAEYVSTPYWIFHKELRCRKLGTILCQDYEHGRYDGLVSLSKLTGRKIFAAFQGGIAPTNRLKKIIRKLSINLSNGIIAGSKTEIERVKNTYELDNSQIVKIFNPLSTNLFTQPKRTEARKKFDISETERVALWHGRVDLRRKGLDLLVEAWQHLLEKIPTLDCRLLLLGYGNDAEEFRRLLASANNPTIKWFAEYTNDRRRIQEFLSTGDVYVFPSRHEGFPLAPIEAMSSGLPVLATDAPGISDILGNGSDSGGIVVAMEDVAALAANLEKLFFDARLRLEMGEKARRRAESAFSVEKVGKQLRDFIERNSE